MNLALGRRNDKEGLDLNQRKHNHSLNILHVDLDAFFASVEERDNPSLKGRPVVVGGRSQRGIITTANYEARKYGLHSAMPIFQAKRLCPEVIIVPTRIDHYREISSRIFDMITSYVPIVEKLSVDEATLDLSAQSEDPIAVLASIKKDLYREHKLTLSAGLSYNKFLAKLASEWNKPNGFKVITPDMIPDILIPLPVSKVHGIGKVGQQKLRQIGIETIGDLLQLSEEVMMDLFGKIGSELYQRIRGIDHRPVTPNQPRKSIGIERTFEKDITSKSELITKIEAFAKELSSELKLKNVIGKTITLKLKDKHFKTVTRSHTLQEPTDDPHTLLHGAHLLLEHYPLVSPIRLLGLSLSGLRSGSIRQLSIGDYLEKPNNTWY